MEVFSKKIAVPVGSSLGGVGESGLSTTENDSLEINGFSFLDQNLAKRCDVVTVDALYAGELVDLVVGGGGKTIFAASHTHLAPMLDRSKPTLGAADEKAIRNYANSINIAERLLVDVDLCRIYVGAVTTPVYRRHDYPKTIVNKLLSRYSTMYPNELMEIDKNIYLFEFSADNKPKFVIAYHACHPISRNERLCPSPDYIGTVRNAVRKRFGQIPCLFFLGCAGDVRTNVAEKRISWLPRNRLNWRFSRPTPLKSQHVVDEQYDLAVLEAALSQSFAVSPSSFKVGQRVLRFKDQSDIKIPIIAIGESLKFEFWPFEVSHLFHLEASDKDKMRFIVSCSNRTLGYLPHPTQLEFGGYEVDVSRKRFTEFSDRVEVLQDWL